MSSVGQPPQVSVAVLSASQLSRRYIVALSLIAILTIVSQAVVQLLIADQQHDSRVVNIAGRQRMLSQKITKTSYYIANAASPDVASRYGKELKDALGLWERSHAGLLNGDRELELPGQNSPEVIALFVAIQPHHEAIVAAAKRILSVAASTATLSQNIREIAEHESAFLVGMNDIVFRYDAKAKAKIEFAKWLELALLSITLLVLALEAVFIFAPATRRIKRDTQELVEKEARLRATLETALDGVVSIDADGNVIDFNPAAETIFGWKREEILGRLMSDILIPRQHRQAHQQGLSRYTMTRTDRMMNQRTELTALRRDGAEFPVELTVTAIRQNGKDIFTAYIRDITEHKFNAEAQRIAATAFESHEGMSITDASGKVLRVNKAFTEITGYAADEIVGEKLSLLKSGRHDASFYTAMWESIRRTGAWRGEIWNRRKNGEVYPEWLSIAAVCDDAGTVTHYVGTFNDITVRKAAEDEINNLAFFDPLTQLPNRRLLQNRLQQALASSTRSKRYGALLFIDLDNFKTLNDTLGHDVGDLLLQQVAQRLTTCVREGDTVARLGGDEFVVMLEDLSEDEAEAAAQTTTVGEKILMTLNQAYALKGHEHRSTPSIGITLFADHQDTIDELLKRADLAMYQAKVAGGNTLRFFDPAMQAVVTARAALEADLRQAVLKDQFILHYQAQVVGEGRVTGVEALLRWHHPQRGIVSPAEFIPLAEDTALILPIGHWVLQTACVQLALWAACPEMAHLTIAVNVSARQFRHKDFVEQVQAVIAHTGANAQRLKLELTESLLVDDVESVIAKMTALKMIGVGFSLDDFGTGYSSLSYLKRLPLDQLKIDQGFVRDVLTDANDAAIAKMIVVLSESLGLVVIAEGVEVEAQREFLAYHGCHAYQGYLFSRPLPLADFERVALKAFDDEKRLLAA